MSLASKSKRLMYLIHRWTGIAGCLLMLVWFISGIVMLYVGYPKLTPWERLAALPELDAKSCCSALKGPAGIGEPGAQGTPVLTTIAGVPSYVVKDHSQWQVYDGATGTLRETPISHGQAVQAALDFVGGNSPPQATVPPASLTRENPKAAQAEASTVAEYLGLINEDQWTHSRGLDSHRPLHKVHVEARDPTTLYVSSRTGQVVLDAPVAQQRWNYIGAWLHWLYVFRTASVDPVWSWIVIVLSFVGTLSALSGVCVGIWRWRFSGRYKSGSHSPYREPWMKWHHIAGLLFGGFVCTWIFSGLMSMNPVGIFSSSGAPNLSTFEGTRKKPTGPLADSRHILRALKSEGFHPVELAWHSLAGQGYVLARDSLADTRIVKAQGNELTVAKAWSRNDIAVAARRLFAEPVARETLIVDHDIYYYQRHPEAMNGATIRGLPALRLDFADAARTRVYVDMTTGMVGASLSRPQRIGRWLFYFLHSWDTPTLLGMHTLRDAILIALSLGGTVVSAAGIIIAWRRLRRRGAVSAIRPGIQT